MIPEFFAYEGNSSVPPEARNKAILSSLDDDDWGKLIVFGALRRYRRGSRILAAGSRDRALNFVISGSVRLSQPGHGSGRDQDMAEGNVFGMATFLDGEPSEIEAIAEGEVEIFLLTWDAFERMAAWHPRIAMILVSDIGSDLAGRLREHRDLV